MSASGATVILAEKPSVAKDIARVLGVTQRRDGYLEGNGYQITWAVGHLVEIKIPSEHAKWDLESLPILPQSYDLVANSRDSRLAKQLAIIGELFENCKEIIVATDAAREGEHIFRLIYKYHSCNKPFKRLWISSLTDKAILEGFENLKDGSEYDNLAFAARLRAESDLLVGVNATRALTKSVSCGKTLSLGRVQTPTLSIICSRFLEHKNFKPEDYFQLQIGLEKEGASFKAISQNYKDKAEAEKQLGFIEAAEIASIVKVESKEKKEAPPLLYDLTALQQEANKRLGYSAEETLNLAQSLYEKKKVLTYPRTSSRYIGDDLFAEIPELINGLSGHSKLGEAAKNLLNQNQEGQELNKRSVNASKVTDHHAILPTGLIPEQGQLSEEEQTIYDLVAARMLEAFHKTCIKEITQVDLVAGEKKEKFLAKGTVIIEAGWRSVQSLKEESGEENDQAELPKIAEGEELAIKSSQLLSKKTKPKPIHSEATLLKAMETAGREIEDEEAREAMKEGGLGTPATRAATIEKLISRAYVERTKKKLVPTEQGLAIYKSVKEKKIASPALTGDWEKKLSRVEQGKLHPDDFEAEIIPYVKEATAQIKEIGSTLSLSLAFARPSFGTCPSCKDGQMQEGKKTFYCSNYKALEAPCKFVVWKTTAGKTIPVSQIKTLIEKGKSGLIKGFTSKQGKPFDAYLVIKEVEGETKVGFDFVPNGKAKGKGKVSKSKRSTKKKKTT